MPWQSIISPDPSTIVHTQYACARTHGAPPRSLPHTHARSGGALRPRIPHVHDRAPCTFGTLARVESGQG